MKKFGFLLIALLLACGAVMSFAEETDDAAMQEEETADQADGEESEDDAVAGKTNSTVRLRKEPSPDAVAISTLEKGTEVYIYQSKSTDDFLYVKCYAPYGKGKAWLTGYVMWDYVDEVADEEEEEPEVVRTGRTNSLVRLRKEPFADGMTISKLPKGTKVYVYESESTSKFLYVRCYAAYLKGSDWITGYVMRKYVDFDDEVSAEETAEPEAAEETAASEEDAEQSAEENAEPAESEELLPEETAEPEEAEEPAAEDTAEPEEPVSDEEIPAEDVQEKAERELGPAQAGHTNNQVRMRKEPARDSITMAKLSEGTKVYVYPSASRDGFLFVKCYAVSGNVQDWTYGYIMEKYVDLDAPDAPDETPEDRPEPPQTPEPETAPVDVAEAKVAENGIGRQARTTAAVRLRKEASAKSMAVAKLQKDAVVYVFDEKSTDDYWYVKCCTTVGGKVGWINGYLLKEFVNASEAVAAPEETVSPNEEENAEAEQANLKEGKTTAEVRLRQEPASYSATVSVLPKNTEIWIDESASTAHYWFVKCYASYFEGDEDWVTGYILKDYAQENP